MVDGGPKTEYDQMPKVVKFVLLFEGTGNHDANPSAMGHLYDMLKDNRTQRKHIVSGSGTHGFCLWRLLGRAFGYDAFDVVLKQYQWLTAHVVQMGLDSSRVEIYAFGFSRGGYQARLFCDILTRFGIPSQVKECKNNVRKYWLTLLRFIPREYYMLPTNIRFEKMIRYVGLIDPVRALIPGFVLRYSSSLPDGILGRCAFSIDEKRRAFYPQYKNGTNVDSQWFSGVHSDVGWAYNGKRATKVLGKMALKWLLAPVETQLEFINYLDAFPDNFLNAVEMVAAFEFIQHNSLKEGLWWLAGTKYRWVCRRHKSVRAVRAALRSIGVKPPKVFAIWPFPSKWFRCINRRRVIPVVRHLLANRPIVEGVFRRMKLY